MAASEAEFDAFDQFVEYPQEEMLKRSVEFYEEVKRRRTIRDFSSRPVPREIIENCLKAAGTAPNGANLQPWHFSVVMDMDVKRKIRIAAEEEERNFYEKRAPDEWLEALAPLGTDWRKSFLESAPYLIAIFGQNASIAESGKPIKNYYVKESVGIATGILITALHHAGLATLTHTPSPMNFLSEILGRPSSEKPYLLLVVGYPSTDAKVPKITKKNLEEIASFI